jgi:hypothetical protein
VLQIELPLHRQFRVGGLSFCFLCHWSFPVLQLPPFCVAFYRGSDGFTSNCTEYFVRPHKGRVIN